jgi:hypothetical protein
VVRGGYTSGGVPALDSGVHLRRIAGTWMAMHSRSEREIRDTTAGATASEKEKRQRGRRGRRGRAWACGGRWDRRRKQFAVALGGDLVGFDHRGAFA